MNQGESIQLPNTVGLLVIFCLHIYDLFLITFVLYRVSTESNSSVISADISAVRANYCMTFHRTLKE